MRLTPWALSGILAAMLIGCLEAIWRLTCDQHFPPRPPQA